MLTQGESTHVLGVGSTAAVTCAVSSGQPKPAASTIPPTNRPNRTYSVDITEYNSAHRTRSALFAGPHRKLPGRFAGRPFLNWVTKGTQVAVYLDTFGEALQGLDVRSLKECTICHRLFLARRVDSVVCDPNSKCAKTIANVTSAETQECGRNSAQKKVVKRKTGKVDKSWLSGCYWLDEDPAEFGRTQALWM